MRFGTSVVLRKREGTTGCGIINYGKLSIEACTHESQNERLPLRIILQILFFEQKQLRTALAGCLQVFDPKNAAARMKVRGEIDGQMMHGDGWVMAVQENQVLRVGMENVRSRGGKLEEECKKLK